MSVDQLTMSPGESNTTASPICVDCGSGDIVDCGPCRIPSPVGQLSAEEFKLVEDQVASRLYHCNSCALGFRHPGIDDSKLQRLYSQMPVARWQSGSDTNVAWHLAHKWLLQKYAPNAPLRVLDVGAFDGAFLSALPTAWSKSAIEPSGDARVQLELEHIGCIADFLGPPQHLDSNRFDVVTMFDIFEHLSCPGGSMQHAMSHLKPGGHLLLSTGSTDHWTWQLLKGDHWYCSTVQHIRFASRAFLEATAQKLGGKVVFVTNHGHQQGTCFKAAGEAIETLAFAARRDCLWWWWVCKLMMRVPGFAYLRHKSEAPYAPTLRDHILIIVQKRT